MYLTEAEKQDKEVTESWKGDTDGILVFVRLTLHLLCIFSLIFKSHIKDWTVLRHRRCLHHRKLSEPISCFGRYDKCAPCSNISAACQHLPWGTSYDRYRTEQSAFQANSIRR